MTDFKNHKEIPDLSEWIEQISSLEDKKFFNIMHLYLGEIKTPYNKQNLVSKLTSFLKNPENLKIIKSYLSDEDLKILAAIKFISCPTQTLIASFFKDEISLPKVYSKLQNLNERLIIYYSENKYSKEKYIKLNPIIKNEIDELLVPQILFSENLVHTEINEDSFCLSPLLLAAFISYISINGISCKNDGIIKKNDMIHLCEIFGEQNKQQLQLLMNAFINLSLVTEEDNKFSPNFVRIKSFANFDSNIQNAFICAASVSRFSRDGLRKEVQLLCDCLNSLENKTFSEKTLIQLSYVIQSFQNENKFFTNSGSTDKKSRFEMMLQKSFEAENTENNNSSNNANYIDTMFFSAVSLGLIKKAGYDEKQKLIYRVNNSNYFENINNVNDSDATQEIKCVNIDSIFSVTIMPGLPLKNLLDFSQFLCIKKIDVIGEFEITKKSVSKFFDNSKAPDDIFAVLEKYSYHKIPDNLKFNIEEWYSSYNSAVIYKGYVLKISDQNVRIIENDERFKKFIKEKLADGVYLLNIPNEKEFSYFQKSCGLDFFGKIRTAQENSSEGIFPVIQKRNNFSLQTLAQKNSEENKALILQEQNNLLQKLQSLNMTEDAKENLKKSIQNKIIINESQLTPYAVRTEILEASGMDFLGKFRILEEAEKNKNLVEITIPDFFVSNTLTDEDQSYATILATPVLISRQDADAIAKIEIEPSKEIKNILVSKITYIKWLKE
ncbi:MAG: hypothetical protein PUC37_06645 [Spirochaetales bacterium]|nr:hypothetical protein [Spirochaetales bacterium]